MTTDVDALIARLDARKWLAPKPESSLDAQAADALRTQAERIAGLLDQHARDSAELRRLCDERDKAKREVKTWQDATGICNQANERMQIAAMEAGCPDETEVADWIIESHNSKSEVIQALQKALAYWMPSVFDERSGHDAYLLVGYEGETESECWGDKAQERIQKQALENISLFDQCRQALDERDKAKARIQALEAKCAELERDAAWRPIETAPRSRADGYCWMHLAWGPEGDVSTGIGMRWGDRFFAAGTFHCLGQRKRYEFREIEVQPTHWMPLYAAPIAAQAGSKEGA